MQQELSPHIERLLYHHDRLNVPGLGTFELSHAPALVDQVQGQVSAPAKLVRFNENLVMDDGLLIHHLQTTNNWSLSEAELWVSEQVKEIKAALERREIVEMPGVGRFFRNFEKQLQFVAENANFNTSSFGLQDVKAQPIARSQHEKIQSVTSTATTSQSIQPPVTPSAPPPEAAQLPWLRQNAWWLALLLLIALVALAYPFLRNNSSDPQPTESPVADIPEERLNTSPTRNESTDEEAALADDTTASPADDTAPANEEIIDTEAPTIITDDHVAEIAVGLFGDESNAQRMTQRIAESGYSPVSRQEGRYTRVGVSVRYKDDRELQRTLRELQQTYTKSAFIMSVDGKKYE